MTFDARDEISLYGNAFDLARSELDIRLREVVSDMVEKGLNAGSVTLKIDISTEKEMAADNNAPMGTRPAMLLEISADVTSVIQAKEKSKIGVVEAGEKELVMDDTGRYYAVSREEASGQLSMFNSWDEYRKSVEEGA